MGLRLARAAIFAFLLDRLAALFHAGIAGNDDQRLAIADAAGRTLAAELGSPPPPPVIGAVPDRQRPELELQFPKPTPPPQSIRVSGP